MAVLMEKSVLLTALPPTARYNVMGLALGWRRVTVIALGTVLPSWTMAAGEPELVMLNIALGGLKGTVKYPFVLKNKVGRTQLSGAEVHVVVRLTLAMLWRAFQ